ncbi:hypothetical protein LCL97_13945 [Seohaeicola saemankumensis]|nr:hypothetical protein [Seohaeicola saemankumensis]MCA0871937.1 hypothetical protein [Seohaeicola saemankumensis]
MFSQPGRSWAFFARPVVGPDGAGVQLTTIFKKWSHIGMKVFIAAGLGFALSFLAATVMAGTPTDDRIAFSSDFTGQVVGKLEGGISECQAVAAVYRFDCYRQNYRAVGRSLNGKPDYRDAQKALKRVEDTLKAVVKQNGDRGAPPLKQNGRTYKAVRPDTVAASAAAFNKARQEAVTILLRADGKAQVHYQRIASVVGSNKVIIRTDLLAVIRLV